MEVQVLTPAEWTEFSEKAHLICFNEVRPSEMDRISFALLVVDNGVPLSYMTCSEADAETVHMQWGGAFPSCKSTALSYRTYEACLNYLKSKYKRATTLVLNYNTPMLRFAMKAGLRITGMKYFQACVFLLHTIEFQEEILCGLR